MFYYLYEILDLRLFGYTTVRAGIAFFLSFALTIYLMPKFIAWARARHANQPIYELAPKKSSKKVAHSHDGRDCFCWCDVNC